MLGKKEYKIPVKVDLQDEEDNPVKKLYTAFSLLVASMFQLRKKECAVLSEILYQNYRFKDIINDDKLRWNAVMDSENRKLMQENINTNRQTFSNCLTELRKKDLLKGNRVIKNLVAYPDESGKLEIVFKFEIQK